MNCGLVRRKKNQKGVFKFLHVSCDTKEKFYGRRLSPCLSWDISPLILESSPFGHFASVNQMCHGLPFPCGVLCRIYGGTFRAQ